MASENQILDISLQQTKIVLLNQTSKKKLFRLHHKQPQIFAITLYKTIAAIQPKTNKGILKWINVGTTVSQI